MFCECLWPLSVDRWPSFILTCSLKLRNWTFMFRNVSSRQQQILTGGHFAVNLCSWLDILLTLKQRQAGEFLMVIDRGFNGPSFIIKDSSLSHLQLSAKRDESYCACFKYYNKWTFVNEKTSLPKGTMTTILETLWKGKSQICIIGNLSSFVKGRYTQ